MSPGDVSIDQLFTLSPFRHVRTYVLRIFSAARKKPSLRRASRERGSSSSSALFALDLAGVACQRAVWFHARTLPHEQRREKLAGLRFTENTKCRGNSRKYLKMAGGSKRRGNPKIHGGVFLLFDVKLFFLNPAGSLRSVRCYGLMPSGSSNALLSIFSSWSTRFRADAHKAAIFLVDRPNSVVSRVDSALVP